MNGAKYFRERAAQCRLLADTITARNDPAIGALRCLAAELDANAAAIGTQAATEDRRHPRRWDWRGAAQATSPSS